MGASAQGFMAARLPIDGSTESTIISYKSRASNPTTFYTTAHWFPLVPALERFAGELFRP